MAQPPGENRAGSSWLLALSPAARSVPALGSLIRAAGLPTQVLRLHRPLSTLLGVTVTL